MVVIPGIVAASALTVLASLAPQMSASENMAWFNAQPIPIEPAAVLANGLYQPVEDNSQAMGLELWRQSPPSYAVTFGQVDALAPAAGSHQAQFYRLPCYNLTMLYVKLDESSAYARFFIVEDANHFTEINMVDPTAPQGRSTLYAFQLFGRNATAAYAGKACQDLANYDLYYGSHWQPVPSAPATAAAQ